MSRGTTNIPVVGVIIKKDGKILAVRRANTDYQNGYYGLPAGHVEAWESFSAAACREVLEEVGLRITPQQLRQVLTVHERHSDDVRLAAIFEAIDWEGEPINAEPDKHDEITWLDPANLPENLMETLAFTLQSIAAGKTYAEYGW